MEATFQSYLAEAVYTMEREKRQRPESESDQDLHPAIRKLSTTSSLNHGLISYIDADSDHDVDEGPQGSASAASGFPKESADLVSAPVKMRQGGSNR